MRPAKWIFLLITGLTVAALAQNCPLPPVLQPLQPGVDIFSDEQESYLGDAMAEQVAPRLKVIENDALTGYLSQLGDRLVLHLPPTNLKFRFYLIDLPEPNAFSIAGGRVYVSRKVIRSLLCASNTNSRIQGSLDRGGYRAVGCRVLFTFRALPCMESCVDSFPMGF